MARILVIDDDQQIREMLTRLLQREGHEVTTAANGVEGVHLYQVEPADLVITDLIMPEKEGLETIIELRRDYPELKIIAISGGGRGDGSHYLNAAKLCGAARILTKPFKTQELCEAVDEVIHGS